MIKFGVTRRDEFARYALEQERAHKGWWPFAYALLGEPSSPDCEFEEALVERIYQSMSAGDGIYKITRSGRFTSLDEQLAIECLQRFPSDRPLVVQDLAVSNGITSLELYRRLTRDRPVELNASDYFDRMYLVTPPGTEWSVSFDIHGRPLQISNSRFVFSANKPSLWRYAINRAVQHWVWKRVLPVAQEMFQRVQTDGQTSGIRTVQLFHRECLEEIQRSGTGFHLGQRDVFAKSAGLCDVVRTMNFLTGGHLPLERIPQGIYAAGYGLKEGGLLVLGRTVDEEDGRIRATIYQKRGNRLYAVWGSHGGYECHSLAETVRWDHSDQIDPAPSSAD